MYKTIIRYKDGTTTTETNSKKGIKLENITLTKPFMVSGNPVMWVNPRNVACIEQHKQKQ